MSSADGRDNANNETQNALALADGADKKLNDSSIFASVSDEISAVIKFTPKNENISSFQGNATSADLKQVGTYIRHSVYTTDMCNLNFTLLWSVSKHKDCTTHGGQNILDTYDCVLEQSLTLGGRELKMHKRLWKG